jgi:phytoene dehydrogenase-like protein
MNENFEDKPAAIALQLLEALKAAQAQGCSVDQRLIDVLTDYTEAVQRYQDRQDIQENRQMRYRTQGWAFQHSQGYQGPFADLPLFLGWAVRTLHRMRQALPVMIAGAALLWSDKFAIERAQASLRNIDFTVEDTVDLWHDLALPGNPLQLATVFNVTPSEIERAIFRYIWNLSRRYPKPESRSYPQNFGPDR